MREIAVLALLLLPNWGYMSNLRAAAYDVIRPVPTKLRVEQLLPSIKVPPRKASVDDYVSSARAVYSVDLASNTVLSTKNPDDKLQVASLTKLMTAYVYLKDNPNLQEVVTVPSFTLREGDAVAGISAGERLSKEDILTAMLINSGSDAAQALSVLDAGSQEAFVAKMNLATTKLGLTNTHFANPVGWDSADNYSSARDIANLTRILLGNEYFKATVTKSNAAIATEGGRTIALTTTNQLLGGNGYEGVKTGYTYGALECLVSLKKTNDHETLTVVLGSTDRFGETSTLNTWTNDHFLW